MPKITDLSEATAVDGDDVIIVVEDGVSKKVTVDDLSEAMGGAGADPQDSNLVFAVELYS